MKKVESATGILIEDRAVLMVRPRGKDYFLCPGGKPEPGESYEQALCRELKEEIGITVLPENLAFFGIYYAPAKGQTEKQAELHTYLVNHFSGRILPSNEVEEIGRFNTVNPEPNPEHSIFHYQILPSLFEKGLVD